MIDYQLSDRTAIVTGGVSGIGLAVAQTLAASGARVSVWDLKQAAVDATLASDDASFATGTYYAIAGGYLAQ